MKPLEEFNEQLLQENKELREKNQELTRSNTELASFNYIASHDLQDPLRKIQLFISRIHDDKELILSDKNQDYFRRLHTAANRMQLLIDNLLSYSKINGNNNSYESVNLNDIIENVMSELIHLHFSEQEDVVINYNRLPIIKGIPFQLKQLFTNLLENSIKYHQPGKTPVIDIHAVMVTGKDFSKDSTLENKRYHAISLKDNGIGFEQQYAEKIFALFQRLHDKQSYSGTGIGLAICKKVVENHNGFITATSIPNEGSTFTIYIPV